MDLRKCLGMVLIWVACLLVSMATEAEAQSYGSSDAPEALHSHSMLFKDCLSSLMDNDLPVILYCNVEFLVVSTLSVFEVPVSS
uniref:Uncharacterized protein n=1 Tax=Cucumis sativus TaxID=3659 RepID=A0A0A0KS19_CUCSA